MSKHRYPKHKGAKPRGCISHAAEHIRGALKGGKLHSQFDPHFEVKHQNEPTTEHPIQQHKQFKGHTAH